MSKFKVIRKEGGSRVLAVTDIIPKGWTVVETSVRKLTNSCVVVKIDKVK